MKAKPKILVAGGMGRIGRRYCAILSKMKADYHIYDPRWPNGETPPAEKLLKKSDKVLIASPTDTHIEWISLCQKYNKDFLCEKPVSTKLQDFYAITTNPYWNIGDGYVVCNYKFALQFDHRENYTPLKYNYFNPGDYIYFSAAQLIYINPDIELATNSPVWELTVEFRKRERFLPYRQLELSYISMLENWLFEDGSELWTLEDGKRMTQAVLKRMEKDNADDLRSGPQ